MNLWYLMLLAKLSVATTTFRNMKIIKMKQQFQKIPKLPLSALIFYLSVLVLWKLDFISSPAHILVLLENLYSSYGLIGLFAASFLEGIVYFGLYFPGSFIVALAVIISDGTFKSLTMISLVVAFTLTLTSIINYILGRSISASYAKRKNITEEKSILSKGLIVSMLHPNALAFYFFNSGIKKQSFLTVFMVPFVMIPYGLALGYLFYFIKDSLKRAIESPYIMITMILAWILVVFLIENKNKCGDVVQDYE